MKGMVEEEELPDEKYVEEPEEGQPTYEDYAKYPPVIESDVQLGQEILEIAKLEKDKDGYLKVIAKDLTKANLSKDELAVVKQGLALAAKTRIFGKKYKKDMTWAANAITYEMYIWIVASRGEMMKAATLAKTSISQTEEKSRQFITQQAEEIKKPFWKKLF